jgi:hypothetical protein
MFAARLPALLLLKTGEPVSFGITVELLMLASAAAVVGGLFIASHSDGGGADVSSRVGVASGALVLELLSAVPFLCAVPALFHELAHSTLLHARAPGAVGELHRKLLRRRDPASWRCRATGVRHPDLVVWKPVN